MGRNKSLWAWSQAHLRKFYDVKEIYYIFLDEEISFKEIENSI